MAFSPDPSPPRIAGLVLSSGISRRFPGANKLLLPVAGIPVVRRTVQAYLDGGLNPVAVVVGHQAEAVLDVLSDLPVMPVQNPDFEQGQSRSLFHGVQALPPDARAAIIGVGDQPLLTPVVIRALTDTYLATGRSPVVPRYAGRRGNPVLFDKCLFPELLTVTGDQGGRPVVHRHRDDAVWIDLPDPRPGQDLDTQEDYASILRWLVE